MIKRFSSLLFLLLLLYPFSVFAHPLDISSTTLTVGRDSVSGITFLHPAEVERILGLRGIPMRSVTYGDYYKHQDYVFEYLNDKIRIWSGVTCRIGNFATRERGVDEIFAEGFLVSYVFSCEKPIGTSIDVGIDIFVDLPLQTNRLAVFDGAGKPIGYKVLTSSIRSHSFDLSSVSVKALDSDTDGISDEEEIIYRTDPKKADTDGDNYSDGEEVNSGWNPLSSDISPGQKYREKPLLVSDTGSIDRSQDELSRRYMQNTGLLDASGYGGGYLKKTLSGIVAFASDTNPWSFSSLFGLIVFLGFVHAAWPGHSKSLLVAFIIDKKRRWTEGVAFALVFTVTHLADITLLVLVTKYLFSVYDPTPYMILLQKVGAGLLTCFALFMVVRSMIRLRRPKNTEDRVALPKVPIWSFSNISLGLLAGLAPCTFGWSIFLVLFSLGKMEWALPLLGALGIGIFLCLFAVVIVTSVFREKILVRIPKFGTYSDIVSAVSIAAVALIVGSAVF